MENKILMKEAKKSLSGKWLLVIGTFLVYLVIIAFPTAIIKPYILQSILSLLQALSIPALMLGINIFSLSIARDEDASFEDLWTGFAEWWRAIKVTFLVNIIILLSLILLIIPGVIMALSYSMVYFILADDDLGAIDTLRKSRKMMDGYKWKNFRLQLRFLGLFLLCFFPMGIAVFLSAPNVTPLYYFDNFYSVIPLSLIFLTIVGLLFLIPYIYVTTAKFYDDVKGNVIEVEN